MTSSSHKHPFSDIEDPAERRAAIAAQSEAATGITEAMIERLVRAFYDRIRADALLGPVFNRVITDWEPHLGRMMAFWSSVVLHTGRYQGQPMQKHTPLPVDARHFDHWLALFAETAQDVCPPEAAAHFIDRAQRIAESLEFGMATQRGIMLRRGERFRRPELDANPPASPPCLMHEVDPAYFGLNRQNTENK